MASEMNVLIDDPQGANFAALTEAVAARWKTPFQEAAIRVRKMWGFVLENAPDEEARALAQALAEKGIKTRVLPPSAMKPLPPGIPVKVLELMTGMLKLTEPDGKTKAVPWPDFTLVCATGLINRETSEKTVTEGPSAGEKVAKIGLMLATGIPLPMTRKTEEKIKTTNVETPVYLDLLTTIPSQRFHIDAQNLNYSFLKEKMAYNIFQNFKILLREVAQQTPNALQNKGTRSMLANEPLASLGYDSLKDLEKEERWLWNLVT